MSVKFIWFHQMQWPDLPDDFTDRGSSWVTPDRSALDPVRANALYNEFLDQWEFAESIGFDALGFNEHHQSVTAGMPTPNLLATAVARRTSKAALAVIGNSIALYNPPIRVAEELAMLDVISGGRVIAGFPVGTSMDANFCYGTPPGLLRDKYSEALDLIKRAWTATEPFAFNGRYTKLRYVNTLPRPLQQPHPPIWIPSGGGSTEAYDLAIDNDYNWSYLSNGGYLNAKRQVDEFWERVSAKGRDESPYRVTFSQQIFVADTDREAEKMYSEHFEWQAEHTKMNPGFTDAPGYRSVKSLQAGMGLTSRWQAGGGVSRPTFQDMIKSGAIIAGSPETVADQMKELITTLRVGAILCWMQFANMPDWKTRYNATLFAEKVMPKLRGLWPEWEHEQRFWCHPLETRVNPLDTIGGTSGAELTGVGS